MEELLPIPHKIQVWSRLQSESASLQEANANEPHIWISFHDPCDNVINLPPNKFRKANLQIPVHDLETGDDKPGSWFEGHAIFNETHAKMVVDFVDCWKDQVSAIFVNCEAGISRSAGCAAAISIWLKGHDSKIAEGNGFHPNATVKGLILRELKERQNGEA